MTNSQIIKPSELEHWQQLCVDLAYAWEKPKHTGQLKLSPEDFQVEEVLGFEPDGAGEHLMLWIEKQQITTLDAQGHLAKVFQVPLADIAYSGMKDKQAITRQWFSIRTGMAFNPDTLPSLAPEISILSADKNSRKLRIGSHQANRFKIRLTNIDADPKDLSDKLALIKEQGVPNYFGPQRFGNDCNTLLQAVSWFANTLPKVPRSRRGLLLSAARAFLFNQLLAQRVQDNTWNKAIEGDVMSLSGSASTFNASRASAEELAERLQRFDIHPSGPLWGKGTLKSSGLSGSMEQSLSDRFELLCAGLEAQGLKQERRPLRLQVEELQYNIDGGDLVLEFMLCKGAYATTVIRELIQT